VCVFRMCRFPIADIFVIALVGDSISSPVSTLLISTESNESALLKNFYLIALLPTLL
jgi:hypothetical protein